MFRINKIVIFKFKLVLHVPFIVSLTNIELLSDLYNYTSFYNKRTIYNIVLVNTSMFVTDTDNFKLVSLRS